MPLDFRLVDVGTGGLGQVAGSGATVALVSVSGSVALPQLEGSGGATGTPASFVLESSDGTQTRSGTAGATGSGADMILDDLESGEIISGRDVTVTYRIDDEL